MDNHREMKDIIASQSAGAPSNTSIPETTIPSSQETPNNSAPSSAQTGASFDYLTGLSSMKRLQDPSKFERARFAFRLYKQSSRLPH